MTELNYLYLYLAEQCNLACLHCWQSAPHNLKGETLSFDRCVRFLDQALPMGLRSVTLSGGEPFLNCDIAKFMRYFSENHISCAIETNGTLLEGELLRAVERYRPFCAISLDGALPATHNKQRGDRLAFDLTVRGITNLERAGMNYQLIMTVSRINYHELDALVAKVSAEWPCCASFKINIAMPEGRGKLLDKAGVLFGPKEWCEIVDKVGQLTTEYSLPLMLHVNPALLRPAQLQQRYCCGGHCGYVNALSVLANGQVSICSLGKACLGYLFGDVATIDLPQLWSQNPGLQELHDSVERRLKGVCGLCKLRRICRGSCRAEALVKCGDILAPSPMCQVLYENGAFPERWLIPSGVSATEV